jgi:uncharacterized membrane protein YhiD involved in acid resistance
MPSSVQLLVVNLLLSFVFGMAIAFHVRYIKAIRKRRRRLEIAKGQVLICLAGTILVTAISGTSAIDESSLIAFGLLALGSSFVRFRTPMRSAADTAVMFIVAAVGIAVGLGLYLQAAVVVVFLYLVLFLLESFAPSKRKRRRKDARRGRSRPPVDGGGFADAPSPETAPVRLPEADTPLGDLADR